MNDKHVVAVLCIATNIQKIYIYKTGQYLYAAPSIALIWWVLIMNQIIIKPNIQTVRRHQPQASQNT
jgi:hypothetical protein